MYVHKYTLNISKHLTCGKMLYIDLSIRYKSCVSYIQLLNIWYKIGYQLEHLHDIVL